MGYRDWISANVWNLFSLGFLFALGLVWGVINFLEPTSYCSPPNVVVVRYMVAKPVHNFCASVNSRSGWNEFEFPSEFRSISYVGGSWSVDKNRLFPVGAEGYVELWESGLNVPAWRYTEQAPTGGLLIEDDSRGLLWETQPGNLSKPHRKIRMRINESDEHLADNHGAVTVCFSPGEAPQGPPTNSW